MSDIFISYKREEQSVARKLADALEKEGWTVWWDPKLRAGEHFDDVIEKALNDAKCVIVMWSERSVQSRYVRDEATYALDRNKLVPVVIENVGLPFRFRGVHTLRLVEWDGSKDNSEFRRLVDDISTILGPSPTVAAEAEESRQAEKERPRQQERQWSEAEAENWSLIDKRFARLWQYLTATVVFILIVSSFVLWFQYRVTLEKTQSVEKNLGAGPPDSVGTTKTNHRASPTPPVLSVGKVFRDRLKNGQEGPEMVVIPAGSFTMGDVQSGGFKDELPVRTVNIQKPFAISRFEVTFDKYDQFAKAANRQLPGDQAWGRGRRPVINVSWQDAVEYAKWLSGQTGKRYRLPAEAEWEYAARGGKETAYWWGKDLVKGMANCTGCGGEWDNRGTASVGSFKPNPFGIYDTAGNVWEWVEDCWHDNYNGAPVDGSAWKEKGGGNCGQRVIRGGSWFNRPEFLRASSRLRGDADFRVTEIGFRLAQDID